MNRSSKGFGLTGVLIAVVVLVVSAVVSTSASSAEVPEEGFNDSGISFVYVRHKSSQIW